MRYTCTAGVQSLAQLWEAPDILSLENFTVCYLRSCFLFFLFFSLLPCISISLSSSLFLHYTSISSFFHLYLFFPFYLLLAHFLNFYAFIHLYNFLIYSLFSSLFPHFQILFSSIIHSVLQSIFMFFPFCAFLLFCQFLTLFLLFSPSLSLLLKTFSLLQLIFLF
jgi:hypothetical protein